MRCWSSYVDTSGYTVRPACHSILNTWATTTSLSYARNLVSRELGHFLLRNYGLLPVPALLLICDRCNFLLLLLLGGRNLGRLLHVHWPLRLQHLCQLLRHSQPRKPRECRCWRSLARLDSWWFSCRPIRGGQKCHSLLSETAWKSYTKNGPPIY